VKKQRHPSGSADIFRRFAAEIRHYLRSKRGAPDAEDIVQEGFVRLLQPEPAEVPENSRAWLCRTCANMAADGYDHRLVRERVHVELPDLEQAPDDCSDPARLVEARQQLQFVWRALAACQRAIAEDDSE